MKALVKTKPGFGNLELLDRPIPSPNSNEVKIKVHYAGICGTDVHTYEGHYNEEPDGIFTLVPSAILVKIGAMSVAI